ncbi:ETEC_3214 domain-containing protein [Streptomyces sp. NPDC004134]|uniref:ETEC_3214 domain-containing protein n=1 Tax=Streptomyces sp. NPDC004134 TaxID=3364691 RepID=UPI00368A35E4
MASEPEPAGQESPPDDPGGSHHLGHRFESWTRRNILVVLLLFTALVASSVATVFTTGAGIKGWYDDRYDWREKEYGKLTALRAGYSLETFEEELGTPHFRSPVPGTKFTDNVFEGRDYWVGAVTDARDTVVAYSVTSCSTDFRPEFTFGEGGSDESRLRLNTTAMSGVIAPDSGVESWIHVSGATSNSYVFQVYYGGRPTAYKTYAWGMNDICAWSPGRADRVDARWYRWLGRNAKRGEGAAHSRFQEGDLDAEARGLFARSPVNTYMETSPGMLAAEVYRNQIGVDRNMILTAD